MKVSDALLGSRFWYSSDTEGLSRMLNNYRDTDVKGAKDPTSGNKHDSRLTSFFLNGTTESVKRAINYAEVFANSHVLGGGKNLSEKGLAAANANSLGVEVDNLTKELAELFGKNKDRLREKGWTGDLIEQKARVAIQKLLASREFCDRAVAGALTTQGRDALRNAAMGLTAMLLEGTISEKAVLALADGNFYDVSNTADVLKLASTAANRVKEMFVDEKNVLESTNKYCEAKANGGGINEAKLQELKEELATATIELLRLRKEIVAAIKSDVSLSDPTGKEKDDRKFQEKQIREIRETLRAFRYDLDKCAGKKMDGRGEKLRRWFDDLSFSKRYRLTPETYGRLITLERRQESVKEQIQCLLERRVEGDVAPASVKDLAERATSLSHTTNDGIRYYFSGVENRAASFAKSMHGSFDEIVSRGGEREATFSVGANFLLNANIGLLKGELKAGAKYEMKATLSVPRAGGPITVSYHHAGVVEGSLSGDVGTVGVLGGEDGKGMQVKADGSVGGGKLTKRTYANLDELIRDMNGATVLVHKNIPKQLLGWGGRIARQVGHWMLLGLTWAGARISKSKLDNAQYAKKLREADVFNRLDSLMTPRKNAIMIGERSSTDVTVAGNASASAKMTTVKNLSLAAGGGAKMTTEMGVVAKKLRTYASSLERLNAAELEEKFDREASKLLGRETVEEPGNDPFRAAGLRMETILNKVTDKESLDKAIVDLAETYEQLESAAVTLRTAKDADKRWGEYAALIRMGTLASRILQTRARELGADELVRKAGNLLDYVAMPATKMPKAVFDREMMSVTIDHVPAYRTASGYFEFSVDAFSDSVKEITELSSLPSPEGGYRVLDKAISGANSGALGALQKKVGAKSTVKVSIEHTTPKGGYTDVRPWLNSASTEISVSLSGSVPVRLVLECVAKAIVKHFGGELLHDESRLVPELYEALNAEILAMGMSSGMSAGKEIGMMTLEALAEKYSFVENLLKKKDPEPVENFSGKTGVVLDYKTDQFKTLTFSFGPKLRLGCFTMTDDQSSSLTLGVNHKVLAGFGLEAKFGVSTRIVDYSVMVRPTFAALLEQVGDLSATGNGEMLKQFIVHQKRGVLRMMQAVRGGVGDDGDKQFAADSANVKAEIDTLQSKLLEASSGDDALAREAKDMLELLKNSINAVKSGDWDSQIEAKKLARAREFLLVASSAYSFLARRESVLLARETRNVLEDEPFKDIKRPTAVSGRWKVPDHKDAPKPETAPPSTESTEPDKTNGPEKSEVPQPKEGLSNNWNASDYGDEDEKPMTDPLVFGGKLRYKKIGDRNVVVQTAQSNTCFALSFVNGLNATEKGRNCLGSLIAKDKVNWKVPKDKAKGSSIDPTKIKGWDKLSEFEKSLVQEYSCYDLIYTQQGEAIGNLMSGMPETSCQLFGLEEINQFEASTNVLWGVNNDVGTVAKAIRSTLQDQGVVLGYENGHYMAITEISDDNVVTVVDSSSGVVRKGDLSKIKNYLRFNFFKIPEEQLVIIQG